MKKAPLPPKGGIKIPCKAGKIKYKNISNTPLQGAGGLV